MSEQTQDQAGLASGTTTAPAAEHPRRAYSPPRVLSVEPLEAAAANCNQPGGPLGKSVPVPCQSLGS